MIRIFIFILLIAICKTSLAEGQIINMTLNEAIDLASRQSLDAFKQENMYLSSYWEFMYYRSNKLPQLAIGANPFQYNNSIRADYVPQDQSERESCFLFHAYFSRVLKLVCFFH